MKNEKISFEEIMKKNKRQSNFSKRMPSSPAQMDEKIMKETMEFYNSFVKPTVRNRFSKLITNN